MAKSFRELQSKMSPEARAEAQRLAAQDIELIERLGDPDKWHLTSYNVDVYGNSVRMPQCPVCFAVAFGRHEHKAWHLELGK